MSDRTLSHNGYCGSMEFSIDDDCLFGKILFVNDLVTYEAQDVSGLKRAFEEAVDYYLDKCAREGLEADKPFNGTFNVRVGPDLHKRAAIASATKNQSLNDFIKECVEHCLAEKTTLVNLTEHHTHYHQEVLSSTSDSYEEDESIWSPKPSSEPKKESNRPH